MQNVSAFGAVVTITASNTFPVGFLVTSFSDDADPFDFPNMTIADKAMGVNGDLIVWAKAAPIDVSLSIIPNTLNDINLSILFEANRVNKNNLGLQDIITMNVVYPDLTTVTLSEGIMTEGMPANSASSDGRIKTKTYGFTFNSII